MRDAGWDNGEAVRRSGRHPWLKWLLLTGGMFVSVSLVLGGSLGSLAFRHRTQLWSAVRTIHSRLQSDDGARDLFKKNPALAELYANDQQFVDTVRDWRPRIGDLPAQEPAEGSTYSPNADPGEASASIKGAGGAWMTVNIEGGPLAGPVEGEGITRILFGEDEKALEAAREKAGSLETRRDWEEFRKVMLQCGDDTKAAELYRKEPGLRAAYHSESAFLEAAKAWRPTIEGLPSTKQNDAHDFSIYRNETPFGRTKVLTFKNAKGEHLTARWRDGHLSGLELRAPGKAG